MSFVGKWRNQYGSIVEISSDHRGRVEGSFATALADSSFYGKTVPLFGACHGDVIGFSSAAEGSAGAAGVSYTGILRDGKLEMVWHTVADCSLSADREGAPAQKKKVPAWRAFGTSVDTFERVS